MCRFKGLGGVYGAWKSFADFKKRDEKKDTRDGQFEDDVLYIVFLSNFVGILCSRTLHYQFYSW